MPPRREPAAQDLLRSIFVDSPREQRSQRSDARQGRRSSKETHAEAHRQLRDRSFEAEHATVRWDEWICPSCCKKNFLTNKSCRQCQVLPNEQQKLTGAGGTPQRQHPANVPPPRPTGPTGVTAPTLTTGSELKQQVAKLEAMKKTVQELGDQELLTNIKSKLRHA